MANMNKNLSELSNHLEPGEKIVATVYGAYSTKMLGEDTVRNGIMSATDKRLIFYAKKMFGYDMDVFAYDKISSFERNKNAMGHKVTFFTSNNKIELKWISKGEIEEFINHVRVSIGKKNTDSEEKKEDTYSALEKLADLKEKGIITEQEFELKKKELLSKI